MCHHFSSARSLGAAWSLFKGLNEYGELKLTLIGPVHQCLLPNIRAFLPCVSFLGGLLRLLYHPAKPCSFSCSLEWRTFMRLDSV